MFIHSVSNGGIKNLIKTFLKGGEGMRKKISRKELEEIVIPLPEKINGNIKEGRLVEVARQIVTAYHRKDQKTLKNAIEQIKKDIWNIRYKVKHDLYIKL